MKHEPFIGITCDIHLPKNRKKRKGDRFYELVCDHRYPEAVKQAGGYPILLPVAFRKQIIHRYLREIDGVVIVGGDDVDPHLYGEERRPGTRAIFGPRLNFERELYWNAKRRGLPILGICYGMQLINVLEGGTLFQDLRRDANSKFNHRHKSHPFHKVWVDPSSRLWKILRKGVFSVSSEHHQAVRWVAPNFKPAALAPDGIIEAIENQSQKILAVQWHPERTLRHPITRKLFKTFVQICAR